MVAQKVDKEKTASVTHFTVYSHDKGNYQTTMIRDEEIAELTHEQCYNYPNWMGPIKVPACLQSANKLSKMMAEHLCEDLNKDDNVDNPLEEKPFFL